MNTPTPRTDAAANESIVKVHKTSLQLETELTAVTEQRDGLRSGIDYASDQLAKVTEQRDRLDDQVDHILLRLGRIQERMIDAERQRDRLEAEIRLTIMENVHLADGDLCTLKRLKDAIGFEFNEALQPLKPIEL